MQGNNIYKRVAGRGIYFLYISAIKERSEIDYQLSTRFEEV